MDKVMELAKELQRERYKYQDKNMLEDVNIGTFVKADISAIKVPVIVVYDTTKEDTTGWYVACIFDFSNGKPTEYYIRRRTHEEIMQDILNAFPELKSFPRGAEDDKSILEVWM